MKLGRSQPLTRKTALARTGRLRRHRPTSVRPGEDYSARAVWKEPHAGYCTCGCDPAVFSMHLERHHVLTASRLRQEGRVDLLWCLENSMLLAPTHHERHTSHARKIRIEFVPVVALAFAVDVLGEGGAAAYFEAHYNCEVTR